MNKLLNIVLGLIMVSSVGIATLQTSFALVPVSAAGISTSNACEGLAQIDSSQACGTGAGESTIRGIIRAVISILSYIVGVVAVIMVIVAGFKYTKSGGDSNNVSSAKNTLIYALVGLAVAALAQVIVHFAFTTAANTSTVCPYTVKDPNGTVLTGITSGDPLCKR